MKFNSYFDGTVFTNISGLYHFFLGGGGGGGGGDEQITASFTCVEMCDLSCGVVFAPNGII